MSKIQGLLAYSGSIVLISLLRELLLFGELSVQSFAGAVVVSAVAAIGWGLGQKSSGKVLPLKNIVFTAAFVFYFANSAGSLFGNLILMIILPILVLLFVSWIIASKLPETLEKAEANKRLWCQ